MIPKYFSKWFRFRGILDDYPYGADYHRTQRIAWRAYRKGVADTKAKFKEKLNQEL